jgi:hypothetical protein
MAQGVETIKRTAFYFNQQLQGAEPKISGEYHLIKPLEASLPLLTHAVSLHAEC